MRIENRLAAVVLAGGYSSRAPDFKPLLSLGQSTVIENTIEVFKRADIADISVVVGHRAEELLPILVNKKVRPIFNEFFTNGMYSSVTAGVQSLDAKVQGFFLLPADMPLVKSHTVKLLSRAYQKVKADIIYPVFQGERGHPPLIARRLFPSILAWHEPGGLRSLLAQYENNAYEVEVVDEGIILDLDTAEDYHNLFTCFSHKEIPTDKECDAIFAKLGVAERIIRHSQMVSRVASKLAQSLNQAGLKLDVALVTAAGLLHDVAKGKPNHAWLGAKVLRKLGYFKAARIVASHTDFLFDKTSVIDETAVVYLADKLVKGEQVISISARFMPSFAKYAGDDEVLPFIKQRFKCAQSIAAAAERISGMRLNDILGKMIER
ncbi:MAG: NTP transferase domain-containing protein [Pelosinus sp.]|nr:NTP transferase domain-containing protein [Pelosinus sp.]